eukprot:scaffold3476_cov112-Isochrysis_galbana.AAC.3
MLPRRRALGLVVVGQVLCVMPHCQPLTTGPAPSAHCGQNRLRRLHRYSLEGHSDCRPLLSKARRSDP